MVTNLSDRKIQRLLETEVNSRRENNILVLEIVFFFKFVILLMEANFSVCSAQEAIFKSINDGNHLTPSEKLYTDVS